MQKSNSDYTKYVRMQCKHIYKFTRKGLATCNVIYAITINLRKKKKQQQKKKKKKKTAHKYLSKLYPPEIFLL